jgi:hypothetical protein
MAWAATALFGALLATAGHAAEPARAPRSGVHRMEIYNGPQSTVRYIGVNLSPSESAALRALEWAENEATYLQDLQALKALYVSDELLSEPERRLVQQKLYGTSLTTTDYGFWGGLGYARPGVFGYGYNPVFPLGYGYPYNFNYGGAFTTAGVGVGSVTTVTRSLANGVGDEGQVKAALAQVLAQQATPEYAASVDRSLDRAVARAADMPSLRVPLGLAAKETPPPVTVTLKNGDKVLGSAAEETKDWLIITVAGGRKARVRPADVARIDEGKAGAVKPAAE